MRPRRRGQAPRPADLRPARRRSAGRTQAVDADLLNATYDDEEGDLGAVERGRSSADGR